MIRLNRLSYNFGSNWALKDISLHISKGEFIFLTGHSGAGKTTLMRLLYGALPVQRGQATVAGYDLHSIKKKNIPMLRRELGVVFQDFKILPNRSVYENVSLALTVRSMPKSIIDKRVRAIIRALGLENKSYTVCKRLSGGEQQRVAIARAMVVNPKLILADEPTGNLDFELSMHLMDVFKQFNTHGTTIIMATHSREILRCVPDAKVVHLEDGQLCEPPEYILSELCRC
ncbi:cell division ATP-binding protein FtsE [Maridesulfovibrio zosterae]|uniref:cell division ATP-binding protein FtsE n=1 Tax=Maridesulfovibrio zosterae TaxID=82171 RepID=UPI00041910A7|nr:cell division ATP-binding protein FtsE [Maridesulfovibrio zosterae]